MSPIAGQTAGTIGLEFFYGHRGLFYDKKLHFYTFFPRATQGPPASTQYIFTINFVGQ